VFDTNVGLLSDAFALEVGASFLVPLTDPGPNPSDAPLACIHVNQAWAEILVGCAFQACMVASWGTPDTPGIATLVNKGQALLTLVGTWTECPEYGMVSVTILAGSATGTATVTFPTAFGAAPVVLVSGDSGLVICSAESITSAGFTARITSDVNLLSNHTETVYWQAAPAS